jgi:hypothetical protein
MGLVVLRLRLLVVMPELSERADSDSTLGICKQALCKRAFHGKGNRPKKGTTRISVGQFYRLDLTRQENVRQENTLA